MEQLYRIPLVLEPEPEGGYSVTSPALPGLVTEGDTVHEALENVRDALIALLEIYEDLGETPPAHLRLDAGAGPICLEHVVSVG